MKFGTGVSKHTKSNKWYASVLFCTIEWLWNLLSNHQQLFQRTCH